ncbi:MAG: hypothetical protein HDR32_05655 [Treponema sp.]|nr:hypothetical protein [Treponema sp.]
MYVESDDNHPNTIELTAAIAPANTTNKNVAWSIVENNGGATLSAQSGETITVTAQKPGFVEITARTANSKSDTITIIVHQDSNTAQAFESAQGSYTAGDTTITIGKDGTVTIGDSSGFAIVTKNEDGSTTLTVTIDGVPHTIVIGTDESMTYDNTPLEKATPILVANGTETKYQTIQSALDAITGSGDYTIKLPKGTYTENYLHYTGAATVKISGDTAEQYGADVIITGHGENMTQERQRELLEFQGTGNLILENVSFVSDYSRKEHSGDVQAEVVGFDSTGYLAAYNCAFKSHQDTLRTVGKAWFYQCYVEGDVDFIWMESAGIVALYEDCEIVSVYDEYATTHRTEICAPRMTPTSKVGKGIVIYNSTVKEDENGDKQQTYLARTPWNKSAGYWNQVAYIKTTISGVEPALWYVGNPCNTAEGIDQTIIGWKLCGVSAQSCGYAGNGDIVSSEDVAKEFSGRRAILNRLYDTSARKYKKDSETHWDIDALIAKTGWNVAADTSKDLLDGETEAKITTYTFDKEISEYPDLTTNGFAKENGKAHAQAKNKGSTLTFPVTGKAVVTVTGYYKGLGTIGATDQGDALFDFNNGSTSKMIEKAYIVYTGASTVTITAEAETYITKIVVEYDDGLVFAPVEAITVSADGDVTSVAAKKTLQLSAALTPAKPTNDDILWSIVSGADAATIDKRSGLLTALSPSADTTVTVRATSCDKNAQYGEKTITVEALVEGAFDISWLDSAEHSKADDIAPTNGNAEVATGDKGTASDVSAWGGWSYSSGRLDKNWGSTGGLTVTTSDTNKFPAGYDTMYIDFPITAVANCTITSVKLGGANHGTGNINSAVSYKKADADSFTLIKDSITTRSTLPDLVETNINLSAGETVTLRVALGAASEQSGNRSPTIGTVTVSGNKTKTN